MAARSISLVLITLTAFASWNSTNLATAADTVRVRFDIPDKIECRDVTPEKCAIAHPTLKVVEAKFRISAHILEGNESSVVDFEYMISSPGMRMKVLDYLPNTKLESTYADDRVEVEDLTESTETSGDEAKVAYSLLSLSGTRNVTAKKSEQNHYQRIAPKALVLASRTTNRGHGVFYKLRPSNGETLEGAKEFSFLAIVPRTWRGDWCNFTCAARANKKSLISSTIVLAGVEQLHVGMYLLGDREGNELSANLCQVQQADDNALAKQMARIAAANIENVHTNNGLFVNPIGPINDLLQGHVKFKSDSKSNEKKLDEARKAVLNIESRLGRLSGAPL